MSEVTSIPELIIKRKSPANSGEESAASAITSPAPSVLIPDVPAYEARTEIKTKAQSEDELLIEESQLFMAQLTHEFLSLVPENMRHAAHELEFFKVFQSAAKLSPSTLGKRALVRECLPGYDPVAIDKSLGEIAEFRVMLDSDDTPSFSGLEDISATLRKVEISGSTFYMDEGARVLRVLRGMRILRDFFSRRSTNSPLLWKTAVQLMDDRLLEMHFESVFDDQGNIKDSASSELSKLRREIIQTAESLRNKLASILRKLSDGDLVQEELITQRDGR